MRILICDSDFLIIEQLKQYILEYFCRKHIKCPEIVCFSNGESLLKDSGKKDILFLDVKLPDVSGIYVGQKLKHLNKNIIIFIVTYFMEYLDEAMRFHVFRYLSKPLDKQRLFQNLNDAVQLYNTSTFKLPVETKQRIFTIPVADIVCVEAHERKVIVHTIKQDYESIHNLQFWLQILPNNCFCQTHRSYIINLKYVTDFDHSLIHLADQQFEAYLTRRKYTQFKNEYLLYLEGTR